MKRREVLRGGAALAAAALCGAARADALERIRQRGTLSFAVYDDMPPFHVKGQGLDVELGKAIAERLGLKAKFLPFPADDNMNDDLRNMVWKGHYLGYGPADVLLHVPVDRPLMEANPQVNIFAPYYRERVVIARDLAKVPTMESLDVFKGRAVAVSGNTLAGWLMLGADGGAYRETLRTHFADGVEAAQAMVRGECVAVAALTSELETTLRGDPRYALERLPLPQAPREGWVVGCAVKKDAADLAGAVKSAIDALADEGRLAAMYQQAAVAWRRP